MSEKTDAIKKVAQEIVRDDDRLAKVAEQLSSRSRRSRQDSAAVLSQAAKIKPEVLIPYLDDLIDALDCEEAQTRWEVLEALVELVPLESRSCDKAIPAAEDSLFDEDNGFARLAAVRFLCKLGATTENRSERVWPYLDEAIQCYHGNPEYQDMLIALISFAEGKLAPSVKEGLTNRMAFDAENAKGVLQRRSQQILDNLN
ncbi:MAG: hypothetical protein ACI4BI_05685 [Anaerotardibacter sp.]